MPGDDLGICTGTRSGRAKSGRAMRLLSVNVGGPREIAWSGRVVRTAIFKEPVVGPRFVARLNVEGDAQADLAAHGGEQRAVFVYQIESYRYWQDQLARDDFVYGQFGENFTVEGLADDVVCIGDRYRIGTAEFEVTQPRVTCYRVGIRMREPRMPELLVSHRRPGFYLRVLQEGVVEAGQEIVKLASGPEGMTVAEIDALLYLPKRSRLSLPRALHIPALSQGWKGSFQALLDQASDDHGSGSAADTAPSWSGFCPLRVAAINRESTSVISLLLAPTDGLPVPPAQPGQYVTVRLRPSASEPPLLRSYSLSAPASPLGYRISVKREPGGAASGYLHTSVRVGDVTEVAAPRGSFVLDPGERPVALISAGVGATPLLAMLHVLAAERSPRQVWWLHGARNRAEHAFANEARSLVDSLPNGRRIVCYSDPQPNDRVALEFDREGRLTAAVLDEVGVPVDADFYLCGPGPFMEELSAALVGLGVAPDRLRTEIFGPPVGTPSSGVVTATIRPPHPPPGTPGTGPLVSFARSSLSVPWDSGFASLLELAEACDVQLGFGCRTGVCHACETGLVSGEVSYRPEPLDRPAPGKVLACCSRPRTDLALDL